MAQGTFFQGSPNGDSIPGSANNDTLLGAGGNDSIAGNGGYDIIFGGTGNDNITFGGNGSPAGSNTIFGGEGADTIIGLGDALTSTLVGGTGNAAIDVTADGADFINVSADTGRDLILGNYGDDSLIGASVASATSLGQLANGTAPAQDTLVGGFGNDFISIGGASGILLGNQGNDTIAFGGTETVYGGMQNDSIIATAVGNDFLVGGEGNDIISVFGGNNTILGGTGIASVDSLAGTMGDGNDLIVVGAGGARGNDFILGNYGDDTINTSAQAAGGADTLVGGQGNDTIYAGAQASDLIFGNQGNDSLIDTLSSGVDTLVGGMGNDTIIYGNTASVGNAFIYGNEGSNYISVVGGGNDTIFGGNSSTDGAGNGDGNNIINLSGIASVAGGQTTPMELVYGGSGNDVVDLGTAAITATVTGGAGVDVLRVQSGAGNTSANGGGSGLDVFTDFVSGTDRFSFTSVAGTGNDFTTSNVLNIGTTVAGSTLQQAAANALIAGSQVNANAATFQFGSDFYLVADVNKDGAFSAANDVLVDIKGVSNISKNDFI